MVAIRHDSNKMTAAGGRVERPLDAAAAAPPCCCLRCLRCRRSTFISSTAPPKKKSFMFHRLSPVVCALLVIYLTSMKKSTTKAFLHERDHGSPKHVQELVATHGISKQGGNVHNETPLAPSESTLWRLPSRIRVSLPVD